MDRKYNIQLNLSPYANYFEEGGNTGGMTYTPEDNGFIRGSFSTDWTPQGISPNDAVLSDYQQKMVNRADTKQAIAEKGKGFLDKMNSSGGGGWAAAIGPAATNIANAFLDTEASTADRVAGALGIPALANQWRADTSKGGSYLKGMTSALDSMSGKNYIQDASSTFGANNAVKLNNKQIISPISPASALPSLKDFKGNWWRNMGASVVQGAAAGSVGGPWGAAGGALTGLFGSLGGLFGRKKRTEKAYEDFLHKRDTLMSAQQNAFNTAVKNQTLSNMQALANGNMSQRINDMANIRAYGGDIDPTKPFVKESQPKDTVYPTYPLNDFYERGYGYRENSEKNFFPDRDPKDWYKYAAGDWAESMENPADSARMVNLFENRQYLTPEQQHSLWDRLTVRTPQYDEDGYDALQDKNGNWLVSDYFNFNNTKAMGGNLYTDLSPNMINLWNNKQQIDQQKAMNQQFSLGFGNTAFANQFAEGGQMTSADVPENMQYYANGGTHEENPYGGIQVGTDQQGTPNLAEEGEFRWNDFVFSDRINVDANLLSSFNLAPATKHQNKKATKGKLSYADMAKKYAKRNKELENDPITKNSMEAFMQRLANAQEYQKKEAQLEAQKQNELQDYKTALNKQNNNPMYGTMKYNGMGNAATQQGVNSGVGAGMGNPMSNADLSNVNRSGNEMMAAYGGNLFAIGGGAVNPYRIIPEVQNVNNPFSREFQDQWTLNHAGPLTPSRQLFSSSPTVGWTASTLPDNTLDRQQLLVNEGYDIGNTGAYKNGVDGIWGNKSKAAWDDFNLRRQAKEKEDYINAVNNFRQQTGWTENNLNLGVRDGDAITDVDNLGEGQTSYGNAVGNTDTSRSNLTGTISGVSTDTPKKTTTNTNPDAAIPSDPKEVPLYSTAGKYAQFGKGIMPMIWDWANKTNVKYDPNYRDADRLEALANEGPSLRTADTIGGYRAPNLMDVERLNNSARAEGLAQMQAILDAANGNRGFVGAQSAQNNYNTQMGIGNNYVKTQEANNANRLQTDQFNHGINVANQNAINTMYQDNQRAEQTQHQLALSGTAQAAALRQRERLHADEVNTERMKNRAANQAAYVDNALNYFTTQAMENQELNTRNNDPTNPYWIDKEGRTHYVGDSGLTQAIRDAFGNDEYGRNGTFTGKRLEEWNDLTKNKKYSAKYLKEHPELWQHLVTQQREANKIDAEKAEQARLEELEALRGTYQSNLARLNALRDSGAIISDPSYNLYTGWADDDYSGNQGLLRTRNQALDQYITQIGNNYDRYLYEKQLAQNQAKALGGYLNAGQNNNNNYYSYTRI